MTETVRLLVVSRESAVLRSLWSIADAHAWHVEIAVSAWDAMERAQSGAAPHLLLLDLSRGEVAALHLLRWLARTRPELPVIVICHPEDAARNSEATRLEAREVLIRPFDEMRLEAAISRHLVSPENAHAELDSQDIEQIGPDSFFVCAGPVTQKLRARAELLAEADVPALILGEPGSGKETTARLIHKLSVRSGFRFLKVNCADMPADLLEGELFGSGGSSSFGSSRMSAGKFERADKGTIFLDEIGAMPLSLQARLMQVLQEKALTRPGTSQTVSADVRVLAATGSEVERLLAERKLREDLYYRLSAFTVHVSPLRQRRSEIKVLLRHMMHKLARHFGLPPREFSANVLDACEQYTWPGNLKQLETFAKRYLVAGDKGMSLNDFGLTLSCDDEGRASTARDNPISRLSVDEGVAVEDPVGPQSLKSLIQSVKWEAERNAIGTALQETGWNRKAAARLLQVSYRTLLYKIDQYNMTAAEPVLLPFRKVKFSLPRALPKQEEQRKGIKS